MKLTREDIKKYGKKEEQNLLREGAGGLYVLAGGYDYEGYSQPQGIFNSLEKAKEIGQAIAEQNFDYVHIFQYTINQQYPSFEPDPIFKVK